MSGGGVAQATALAQVSGEGSRWQVFARLGQVTARRTKTDKPYLDLVLQDSSRRVNARMWLSKGHEMAMLDALTWPAGTICKLELKVDNYRGEEQLLVERLRRADPEQDEQGGPESEGGAKMLRYLPDQFSNPVLTRLGLQPCRSLVFDIETVPSVRRQDLPSSVAETLARKAEKRDTEPQALMGMSPWLGKCVSLALGEGEDVPATGEGEEATRAPGLEDVKVLAVPRGDGEIDDCPDWCIATDEKTMLEAFWALAAQAECVVTYNGFGFDVPFLVGRSLALGVEVKVDLLGNRWKVRPHLDLFELVKGGGPSSLDVVCYGLGIQSPKGAMDGSMVAPAYERGEILEIARYNRHDVRATAELYRRLRDTVLSTKADW